MAPGVLGLTVYIMIEAMSLAADVVKRMIMSLRC